MRAISGTSEIPKSAMISDWTVSICEFSKTICRCKVKGNNLDGGRVGREMIKDVDIPNPRVNELSTQSVNFIVEANIGSRLPIDIGTAKR